MSTYKYRTKSTTVGVNPQQIRMNCTAVIHSEGEEWITFVDQPFITITSGTRKNIYLILKTPNGLGKRVSKSTGPLNQLTN